MTVSNRPKSTTRILLKLAIALVTFEIGVTVTAIYRFYGVTDLVIPDVVIAERLCTKSRNTTHGSGWFIQILSTPTLNRRSNPTQRQLVDCSNAVYKGI